MNNSEHKRYDVGEWREDTVDAWFAWIYVGGDLKVSEQVCREFCFPSGTCFTVEPVKYIFGGGTEGGVRIGLIQYPPFPEPETDLLTKAREIGMRVAEANFQWSFSIVTQKLNHFYSRRRR